MTIIDSERKRPDPVVACVEAIDLGSSYDFILSKDDMRIITELVLATLNQLGMLNEAYFEAIAEKRK